MLCVSEILPPLLRDFLRVPCPQGAFERGARHPLLSVAMTSELRARLESAPRWETLAVHLPRQGSRSISGVMGTAPLGLTNTLPSEQDTLQTKPMPHFSLPGQ